MAKPSNKKINKVAAKSSSESEKYEKLDVEWREIGLAAPARRVLVDAKLYKVSDLRKISVDELENLHGMGKSAVARIKVIMNAKKIKFRP